MFDIKAAVAAAARTHARTVRGRETSRAADNMRHIYMHIEWPQRRKDRLRLYNIMLRFVCACVCACVRHKQGKLQTACRATQP